jgi:elongation factor G
MLTDLSKIRNIGISAHIDSGKTTLTERILFYTKKISRMHEVKGKDGVGAVMDSMDLERERGITIQSAATHCSWKDHHINVIDTPGHVDFTIEVERSLRVLDGAILVLCGVAGVQSQSMTVDRQMRRYHVPCVAFVNKLDRQGSNPWRVATQLTEKLGHNAVMMQMPIGAEERLAGVIDLVKMRAFYNEGEKGDTIREADIPDDLKERATQMRETLLDKASMFSDELTEAILMDAVTEDLIKDAVRKATIKRKLTPVFMGSAYKNQGVQKLLDGVVDYLPAPDEVENKALDIDNDQAEVVLTSDPNAPFIGLAFKLEEGRFGQLTYVRVYQGTLKKGLFIHNVRTTDKVKVGRLVRMHSNQMEDIDDTSPGDIVALFGIDCRSGDTFTDGAVNWTMTSMHVPEPVIHYTIKLADRKGEQNLSKALQRFTKEDPTFRAHVDEESQETIISGMGELHLDVYLERMRREYGVNVESSPPRVAYREAITERVDYNYTHKKQTGGHGQYARVAGYFEPWPGGDYEFVDEVVGGSIPREFIPSCDKGFRKMLEKGLLIGVPVSGVRVIVNDGQYHQVDSSDMAFQVAAMGAWREFYLRARPTVLEPIMKVELEGPAEFHGVIIALIMQRRGTVVGASEEDGFARVEATVPLGEMFGFSTALRSSTQGKAEFTMEFSGYERCPAGVMKELMEQHQKAKAS